MRLKRGGLLSSESVVAPLARKERSGMDWPALLAREGDESEIHYRHTLEELGKRSGMLGIIFRKAQNKIQDPAKLLRLIVVLIDRTHFGGIELAR